MHRPVRASIPEHAKEKNNLTQEQYYSFIDGQEGVCAICARPVSGKEKRLSVDHDHKTGMVRGLLCKRCNTGLGMFLDDPEALRAAAHYIEMSTMMHRVREAVRAKENENNRRTPLAEDASPRYGELIPNSSEWED